MDETREEIQNKLRLELMAEIGYHGFACIDDNGCREWELNSLVKRGFLTREKRIDEDDDRYAFSPKGEEVYNHLVKDIDRLIGEE